MCSPIILTVLLLFPLILCDYFDDLDIDYVEPIKIEPIAKVPTKTPIFVEHDRANEPPLTEAPAMYCTDEKWYPYFILFYTPPETRPINYTAKICAGTVISRFTILTAAHCCDTVKKQVFIGYMNDGDEFRDMVGAKSIKIHPKYNRDTLAYDMCIVELESGIVLKGEGEIMQLGANEVSISSVSGGELTTNAFVLGYGTNHTVSTIYLSDVETISCIKSSILLEDECRARLQDYGNTMLEYNPAIMLCGESSEKRTSLNFDLDSGGPLIVEDKQIGIASFVVGTANKSSTSLMFYTRIDALLDFVTPEMRSGNGADELRTSIGVVLMLTVKFIAEDLSL